MAGAIIGALRIVLGADSAALDKGLNDARSSVGSFGADMAKAGAVIAAAMTAAYGAVALSVNNTLESMDKLGKQSQKIGVPVEQLSALSLAAATSGVSMDDLGKGMGKLSKAMVEAAAKPTSEAANAFRALGVSATDSSGRLLPVADVMTAMAGKFEGMKDGAGKTAVSMALMGKTGNDLIPMLNMGSDGLAAMAQNAAKFGIVIDSQAAAAATKFRDTLTLLGAAKDGLIVKLTQHMLPALQAFADIMLQSASNSDKQQSKLSFLSTSFDLLARAVLLVADNFKIVLQLGAIFVGASIGAAVISMGLAFAKLALSIYTTGVAMALFDVVRGASMKGLLLIGGIVAWAAGAFDNFSDKIKSMAANISSILPEGGGAFMDLLKSLGINIRGLEEDLTKLGGDGAPKAAKGLTDFKFAAMGGKNAIDKFVDSTKKALAAQDAESATVGAAIGEKEKLKITLQALEVATANHIPVTQSLTDKISALGVAAQNSAIRLAGVQMTQANLTPGQLYTQQLAQINQLYDAGAISATTYNAAVLSLQFPSLAGAIKQSTDLKASFDQLATSMVNNFSSTFAQVITGAQKAGDAFKAFGKQVLTAITEMIVKMLVLKAIQLAIGFVTGGTSLVAGEVASTALSAAGLNTMAMTAGFASGTDFTVPGGIGGGDSVPFNAMLEPGERVKIEPNSYGANDSGGGSSQTVQISLQGESYSRDMVRSLIAKINDVVSNGGPRLVTAPA